MKARNPQRIFLEPSPASCLLYPASQIHRLDDYCDVHRDLWPEMREALTRHGWRNYSLFLRDDGLLTGYCETPDFAAADAGM
jgi:L-rhamnose mutarotase